MIRLADPVKAEKYPRTIDTKRLDTKHDVYKAMADSWRAIRLLYEGGAQLLSQGKDFLGRLPKEPEEVFAFRVSQMFYENNLNTAIGYYHSSLFKAPPAIDVKNADDNGEPIGENLTGPDMNDAKLFFNNCDRKHTKLSDYAKDIFTDLALYKSHWSLIDLPYRANQPTSGQEEQDQNLLAPYLVRYLPEQVINWGEDESGNLNWVCVKTTITTGNPLDEFPTITDIWYIVDRRNYATYARVVQNAKGDKPSDDIATLKSTGPHALSKYNVVPIVRWDVKEVMWLGNRAYPVAREHLQMSNSLSWIIKLSNVPFPIVYSDREVASFVSSMQFLHLRSTDKFEWSEPKGTTIHISMERCTQLVEELYRQCHLQPMGATASNTAKAASGASKKQDWEPMHEMLEGYGDVMRQVMQAILSAYGKARQVNIAAVVRGYNFGKSNAESAIQRLILVQEANIQSPTLQRMLQGDAALTLVPDADEDTREKILQEIDQATTVVEQNQAEQQASQGMLEAQLKRMERNASGSFDASANT